MARFWRLTTLFLVAVAWTGGLGAKSVQAQSCTHFVNATDGDDGNDGSLTAPVRSVEFAFSTFPSGSVICVAAGEYFYGDDADGIQLSGSGKSMQFRLESFAGASEVRFSEKEFALDVGAGVVEFVAGSSTQWVLGQGIVNADDPGQPDLLNFLHTFRIASGTLALQGLTPVFEASVGNPDYVHPQNSDKRPPQTASIRWGNGNVTGNVTFNNAPRTVVFEGSDAVERTHLLPSEAGRLRVVFDHQNPITFPGSLDLGSGTLEFSSTGSVAFLGTVAFDGADARLDFQEAWAGTASFESTLSVRKPSDSVFINQAGSGQLTVSMLDLTAGGAARSTVLQSGEGVVSLRSLTSDADVDGGQGHFLELQNLAGSMIIGQPDLPVTIPGRISNASTVTFPAGTTLEDLPDSDILLNTGTVSSENGLELVSNGFSAVNDGSFSGSSTLMTGSSGTLSGSGIWPATAISSSNVRLASDGGFAAMMVSDATLTLNEDSNIDINGALSATGASTINLEEAAHLTAQSVDVTGELVAFSLAGTARLGIRDSFSALTAAPLFSSSDGLITGADEDGFSMIVSPSADVVPLQVTGGTVTLSGGGRWTHLSTAGGTLTLTSDADLLLTGMDVSGGGVLQVASSGTVSVSNAASVDETSSLSLESENPVDLSGTLETRGGTIDLGDTPLRLTGASVLRAPTNAPIVLPSLLMDDPSGFLTLSGAVSVVADLVLAQGGVYLEQGSRMTLSGDLERSSGSFALESEGTILFSGSTDQVVSGFEGSVLPSLVAAGSNVRLLGSTTLLGSLRASSGALRVESGSILSVSNDVTVSGGDLSLLGNASLSVSGDLNVSAGTYQADLGTTTIKGNVIIAGGSIEAGNGTWLIDPADTDPADALTPESVIVIDAAATLNRLTLAPQSVTRIEGSALLTVSNQLVVGEEASLLLGNNDIILLPGQGLPSFSNAGRVEATSGRVVLRSLSGGNGPTVGGNGVVHNLTVDLASDGAIVRMAPGSSALSVSGELSFLVGALDLNGAALVFDDTVSSSTGLHFNLSDTVPENGEVDGQGLTDSSGPVRFNSAGVPFNLRFSGNATTLFDPPALIAGSTVRNLTIATQDPVNSPALFGLSVSTPLEASGSFRLDTGSVLRLQESMVLSGSRQLHLISGRISGSGSLVAGGAQNELRLEGSTSYVEHLVLTGTDALTTSTLWFNGIVGDLSSTSGRYLVGGPAGSGQTALSILREASLQNTNWTVSTGISTGSNAAANQLSLASTALQFGANGYWRMPQGGIIVADAASLIETTNTGNPSAGSFEGALVLGGSTRLILDTTLPRLVVDIRTSTDDVFLESDLSISESLSLVNGDIRLSGFNLNLLSGNHYLDADAAQANGSSDGILGDISQQPGSVVMSGTQTLFLGSNITIQDALLGVNAGGGSVVGIRSLIDTPVTLSLTGGRLRLDSGELSLGENDISISSSSTAMVEGNGGRITGNAPSETTTTRLEVLEDGAYGELVLAGSGNASMVLGAAMSVDNLRVDGTIRLNAGAFQLTVGRRMVFGQRGAGLLTESSGNLVLAASTTMVRRGSGSLSHAPIVASPFHLAYQLGSGTLTGHDAAFTGSSLTAGLELPQNGRVASLLSVAGSRAGVPNTVRIPVNLAVGDRLMALSGSTVLSGATVSLDAEATVLLHRADASSPASLSISGSLAAAGPYDVDILHGGSRLDVPAALQDAGNNLRSLIISASPAVPPTDVLRFLGSFSAEEILIGGDGLPVDVNLTGNALVGRDALSLVAGEVVSSQLARLQSDGTMSIGPEGRVSGNIEAIASGELVIDGTFAGLELTFKADATVGGSIAPVTAIRAEGEQQSITFSEASSIGTLTLAQSGVSPRLTIGVATAPSTLELTSSLGLESGILSMENGTLILPEQAEVTRSTQAGTASYVQGRIVRPVREGSTSDLLFPTGMMGAYMPLTLSFTSPLLSATDISVLLDQPDIVSQQGFPVVDQEAVINSLAAPMWRVDSSVDFSRSQPYSLSASVPQDAVGSGVGIRILRQREGEGDVAWALVPGTQLAAVTESGITARAFGSRGGLEPAGFWVALGLSQQPTETPFSLQFVDVTGADIRRTLSLGSTPILSLDVGETASGKASFLVHPDLALPSPYTIASGTSPVISGTIAFDPSEPAMIVRYPTSTGDALSTSFRSAGPGPVASGASGVILVNLLDAGTTVSVGEHWSGTEWMGDLSPGMARSTTIPAVRTAVSVSDGGASVEEVFDVDLASIDGETALWLIHYRGADVALTIVRTDGSTAIPAVVTGIDPRDETLPVTDVWLGNYPNPFSQTTTIEFNLGRPASVRLQVFDVLGREVRQQRLGMMTAGKQTVRLDGSSMAGGTYFVHLTADSGRSVLTGRVVVNR